MQSYKKITNFTGFAVKFHMHRQNNSIWSHTFYLLVTGIIFTTFFAFGLGVFTFRSADTLFSKQKMHIELNEMQGQLLLYDEIMTMSARMAASTGDTKWEKRYREVEPLLDQAIKKNASTFPKERKFPEQTEHVNALLVKMENQAFVLVRKKNLRDAAKILASKEYEAQKASYLEGTTNIIREEDVAIEMESSKQYGRILMLRKALLTFLALSTVGWFFVLYRVRLWNIELRSLNDGLERQVQERSSQLVAVSKMSALGEMAGGVAHEINNPLATIKTIAGQIQEVLDDAPLDKQFLKDSARKLEATTNRIARIVCGLRSFSRDGSGDSFCPVDVKQLIDETLSLCEEKFRDSEINVIVDGLVRNQFFDGRATEISQVLLNLLNNAKDAVDNLEEKWIKISVAESHGWIEIRVIDAGKGISSTLQEKIFQPFFTTKEVGKGTGMGLSISLGLIRGHQGELLIDSRSQNTCFMIRIPERQQKAASANGVKESA